MRRTPPLTLAIFLVSLLTSLSSLADEFRPQDTGTGSSEAPRSNLNPYQLHVKRFDEAAAGWQSAASAQRKLLLSCKAAGRTPSGARLPSNQSVTRQREILLDDYLRHLGRPNVATSNRGPKPDGVHFKVLGLKAGVIISQSFGSEGVDACDGAFMALITQVKGRIYQLQQIRRQLNFHSDNRMKQPNIDARFEKRHEKIAFNRDPFLLQSVNRQDICVPVYQKTLATLKQHHEGVVAATKELNEALNRDIARLLAYQGELMDKQQTCGETREPSRPAAQ